MINFIRQTVATILGFITLVFIAAIISAGDYWAALILGLIFLGITYLIWPKPQSSPPRPKTEREKEWWETSVPEKPKRQRPNKPYKKWDEYIPKLYQTFDARDWTTDGLDCAVAGTSHKLQNCLSFAQMVMTIDGNDNDLRRYGLTLKKERNNKYDKNAVAVHGWIEGEDPVFLGYLSRDDNGIYENCEDDEMAASLNRFAILENEEAISIDITLFERT